MSTITQVARRLPQIFNNGVERVINLCASRAEQSIVGHISFRFTSSPKHGQSRRIFRSTPQTTEIPTPIILGYLHGSSTFASLSNLLRIGSCD